MSLQIAAFLVRYRRRLFAAALALVVLLAFGARDLWFEGSYRVFFSEDDSYLVAYDEIEHAYTCIDNVAFVIEARDGRIFTRETLRALHELTATGWTLPRAIRVDSITNFQHAVADGDELIVGDLVPDPDRLDAAEIARLERVALAEPAIVVGGGPIGRTHMRRTTMLQFNCPDMSCNHCALQITRAIQALGPGRRGAGGCDHQEGGSGEPGRPGANAGSARRGRLSTAGMTDARRGLTLP